MKAPSHSLVRKAPKTCLMIIAIIFSAFMFTSCNDRFGQPNKLLHTTTPKAPTEPATLPGATPVADLIAVPPGFTITIFAQGLVEPRMMTIGPDGSLYVAERGAGRILRLPDQDGDGKADSIQVAARELSAPSSLAFYQDGALYVGETTRILRFSNPDEQGVFQERKVIIDGLPEGGHNTRTILFSPDWSKLFVSIGSSCDACYEGDPRRAAIMQYRPDGSDGSVYAHGLRNAVGLSFRPGVDELWATNNGRDMLGDDLPPDTIQVVHQGLDFGWPKCHAGRISDPDLGNAASCKGISPPAVVLQAHSAPLGLTFYSGAQFPSQYQGNLFVALHGSWNRSVPTGYKVVRIPFTNGRPGAAEDFAAGWLRNGQAWGRPVDVINASDGSLLVSDDEGGIIYRITYVGEEK
jgi:glucose/arabinose dehydrogenase